MLSEKQKEAIALRAQGLDETQIGFELGVSRYAVKARLKSARDLVGARNTCELVAIAIVRGEIHLEDRRIRGA